MESLSKILFDSSISGHTLVRPALWYGRQVQHLFEDPQENTALAITARALHFVALLVLSVTLPVIVPAALVGLAIKCYSQKPSSEAPLPPIAPISQQRPADEADIKQEGERLKDLYNNLRDLNGKDTKTLFAGIEAFKNRFDPLRNPDPMAVDDLTKTFNLVDEIARNTEGMRALFTLYANGFDEEGVIAQPKDGNCWLHTSLVGLRHLNHPAGTDYTHETLRQAAIDWIERQGNQDETLNSLITDSIEAHKFVEQRNLQEQIDSLSTALQFIDASEIPAAKQTLEQNQKSLEALSGFTREDYLRHMRIVGSHGSNAELHAISRMFEVNVVIWRDLPASRERPRRLTNEYDPQIEFPGSERTIHAVLTQEGNHFNYRLPPH